MHDAKYGSEISGFAHAKSNGYSFLGFYHSV